MHRAHSFAFRPARAATAGSSARGMRCTRTAWPLEALTTVGRVTSSRMRARGALPSSAHDGAPSSSRLYGVMDGEM